MSNKQVFKALLLAGGASTFAMAAPAVAQDEGASSSDRIVVTGSRIQRQDFEANSPIVTIDETLLERTSTAALESNLNRLPQFTPAKTPTQGGDIQPTATNTPGGATISLRGIGANRNLVLIDGRRATPGNASGVVDISTIPAAAVERVEIITGGA
ncbi:TonB-dependent receptor plug domain-containing protein, partial [Alteraurantiacibacter palmitatis]